MTSEEIGVKMRETRRAKNLTMKQVADYIGVSEGTVSRWENGKVDVRKAKASVVSRLCYLLDMRMDDMSNISVAQAAIADGINRMAADLDEATRALLYAVMDLSPRQKYAVLQMIEAMTNED